MLFLLGFETAGVLLASASLSLSVKVGVRDRLTLCFGFGFAAETSESFSLLAFFRGGSKLSRTLAVTLARSVLATGEVARLLWLLLLGRARGAGSSTFTSTSMISTSASPSATDEGVGDSGDEGIS